MVVRRRRQIYTVSARFEYFNFSARRAPKTLGEPQVQVITDPSLMRGPINILTQHWVFVSNISIFQPGGLLKTLETSYSGYFRPLFKEGSSQSPQTSKLKILSRH